MFQMKRRNRKKNRRAQKISSRLGRCAGGRRGRLRAWELLKTLSMAGDLGSVGGGVLRLFKPFSA